jgi:hypothetical protein
MTDKKSDAGDKPKQTVITKGEWHTQELVAHLLGDDDHSDDLPAKTTRTPGKVVVVNPFNIPEPGPIIDAEPKSKPKT